MSTEPTTTKDIDETSGIVSSIANELVEKSAQMALADSSEVNNIEIVYYFIK